VSRDSTQRSDVAGVVLAAGYGTRLKPLTDLRPKALCPIDNVPLVDLALARLTRVALDVAVNVHAHADQMVAHLDGRAHLSVEQPVPMGSGGALRLLRDWIAGRPVLVHNVDSYLEDDLDELLDGWDGERPRLLVRTGTEPSDFGPRHYVGATLIPAAAVAALPDGFSGLHREVWAPAAAVGTLEFVEVRGTAIDCGTPSDYLRANLQASGGASVVGEGADVRGELVRSVVWPGAVVRPGERLVECIRADDGLTVTAPQDEAATAAGGTTAS
jgi:NDP-sugar pyrophosphorylase family protein